MKPLEAGQSRKDGFGQNDKDAGQGDKERLQRFATVGSRKEPEDEEKQKRASRAAGEEADDGRPNDVGGMNKNQELRRHRLGNKDTSEDNQTDPGIAEENRAHFQVIMTGQRTDEGIDCNKG